VEFCARVGTRSVSRVSAWTASSGTTHEALFVQGDPLPNGGVVQGPALIQGNLPQATDGGSVL
jgi:hypothetical protein